MKVTAFSIKIFHLKILIHVIFMLIGTQASAQICDRYGVGKRAAEILFDNSTISIHSGFILDSELHNYISNNKYTRSSNLEKYRITIEDVCIVDDGDGLAAPLDIIIFTKPEYTGVYLRGVEFMLPTNIYLPCGVTQIDFVYGVRTLSACPIGGGWVSFDRIFKIEGERPVSRIEEVAIRKCKVLGFDISSWRPKKLTIKDCAGSELAAQFEQELQIENVNFNDITIRPTWIRNGNLLYLNISRKTEAMESCIEDTFVSTLNQIEESPISIKYNGGRKCIIKFRLEGEAKELHLRYGSFHSIEISHYPLESLFLHELQFVELEKMPPRLRVSGPFLSNLRMNSISAPNTFRLELLPKFRNEDPFSVKEVQVLESGLESINQITGRPDWVLSFLRALDEEVQKSNAARKIKLRARCALRFIERTRLVGRFEKRCDPFLSDE